MNARDSLVVALPAVLLGLGAGYAFTSLLGAPAREIDARAPARPGDVRPVESHTPARLDVDSAAVLQADRAAAATGLPPAPAKVNEAELTRALASVTAPRVDAPTGSGSIAGTVVDEDGGPLAGAVVVASLRDVSLRTRDPERVGAAAPLEKSLEEHLRDEAEAWAEERARRQRVASGAGGAYLLEGLVPDRGYDVSAYLEGFVIEPVGNARDVAPGRTVAFRGRRVHEVKVDLAYASGGGPGEGVVRVERGNDTADYTWSAERPTLRLLGGRAGLTGYAGLRPGSGSRGEVDSDLASEEQSVVVEDAAGTGVRLVLKARTGIRGRIVDTWAGAQEGRHQVSLLRLPPDRHLDEEALRDSDQRSEVSAGRFQFLDLAAGAYAVGLGSWGEPLVANRIVDVGEGVVEVVLEVPEPDASEHLVVRAFGPSGRALEDVDFSLDFEDESNSSSSGVEPRLAPDGAYWLRLGGAFEGFFESWSAGASYALTAAHSELGTRTLELREGQREVEIRFEEPISIVVEVAGYAGSGYEGRLDVNVQKVVDEDAGDQEEVMWRRFRGMSYDSANDTRLSAEGRARFDGLEPGTWRVELSAGRDHYASQAVDSVEVQVLTGERTVTLDVPVLHDLFVLAPGLAEGTWVSVRKQEGGDAEMGMMWWGGGNSAELDSDHCARFEGLVAGQYVLSANGTETQMDVTVPCGEVYFDAREPDCLRVAIGDMEGWLYTNGLRAGDLIYGSNGVEFESVNGFWELLQNAGDKGLSVLVLRGAESLSLELGALPQGGNWWENMGGMLTPAQRP